MDEKQCVRLRVYDESRSHTAYIELRDHPHETTPGIVAKTIALSDLCDYALGPTINIDFDREGRPVGIEILYFGSDDAGDSADG